MFICIGPNHGGIRTSPVTKFESFYIIMVQQDGLKVLCVSYIGYGYHAHYVHGHAFVLVMDVHNYVFFFQQASPMKLEYSVVWDNYLTQEVVDEMVYLSQLYMQSTPNCVQITECFIKLL